jgi:methionine-rich copper-binding protein CopC
MFQFPLRMRALTLAVLMLGTASLVLGSRAAYAHAHLTRAEPRAGSTVTPAPHEVSLWFTEGLESMFSSVEVFDASGARVDQGEAAINGSTMRIGLKPLPPGTYKVNWRALSVDTHKTDGSFSFQVAK